jgi:hypothetical protein
VRALVSSDNTSDFLFDRYTSDGQLAAIPRLPAVLPAAAEAEIAVAALLARDPIEAAAADGPHR